MHKLATVVVVAVMAVSCGRPAEVVPPPAVTEPGVPVGAATSGVIGPAGGELRSPDGRLSLRFPAGAVSADTTVRIQPITNTAPGGVGVGYLLEPEGQTFAQPVELTLTYSDADVEGSAPEFLGWSVHQANGTWLSAESSLDKTAKTLTTKTTHFSEWTPSLHILVRPTQARVKTGYSHTFEVLTCRNAVGEKPLYICTRSTATFAAIILGDWSVDGVPGGNARLGLVRGPEIVTYTAPSEVPNPSRVTLSATVTNAAGKLTAPLIVHVNIVGSQDYGGRYDFQQTQADAVVTGHADLFWKEDDSSTADVLHYTVTGQVDAHYEFASCDPIDLVLAIDESSSLVIYTARNAALPKQHQFTLVASAKSVTLSCGTPRMAYTTDLVLGFAVGACKAPPFARWEDEAVLTGDETCDGTTSHWRFELLNP